MHKMVVAVLEHELAFQRWSERLVCCKLLLPDGPTEQRLRERR